MQHSLPGVTLHGPSEGRWCFSPLCVERFKVKLTGLRCNKLEVRASVHSGLRLGPCVSWQLRVSQRNTPHSCLLSLTSSSAAMKKHAGVSMARNQGCALETKKSWCVGFFEYSLNTPASLPCFHASPCSYNTLTYCKSGICQLSLNSHNQTLFWLSDSDSQSDPRQDEPTTVTRTEKKGETKACESEPKPPSFNGA